MRPQSCCNAKRAGQHQLCIIASELKDISKTSASFNIARQVNAGPVHDVCALSSRPLGRGSCQDSRQETHFHGNRLVFARRHISDEIDKCHMAVLTYSPVGLPANVNTNIQGIALKRYLNLSAETTIAAQTLTPAHT